MLQVKKLHNNWNINLINIIKLAYIFSLDNITVRIIKKNIIILNLLKKTNFISDYRYINNDIIIIYLYYKNNKKIWNNLKIYYKNSHYFYISTYILKRFYRNEFKKLLFISTKHGIIDHHLALKKNFGGKLYFILY